MTEWRHLAGALAEQLARDGSIRDRAWQAAFASTPRHLFVPRFYTLDGFNQPRDLVDGDDPTQHDRWLDAIYRDQFLVTQYQVADTAPDGHENRLATSSASMPSIVATMLDRLRVADDSRVLEIGTGTGYNAGLLARRVGADRVTTVELDETLAAQARAALAAAGLKPTVVVGNGAAGYPPRAPYDRIIATCAVERIPPAWLEQLAPDGRIVAPLTFGSALAVLDADSDGGVSGRFDRELASFMALRSGPPPSPVRVFSPQDEPVRDHTDVDPKFLDPFGERHDLQLWLAVHLPDVTIALSCEDDGTPDGLILTAPDSRADVPYAANGAGRWPVTQWGKRRLWDELETVWRSWQRQGQPDRTRLGITARRERQWVWLDHPDQPVALRR